MFGRKKVASPFPQSPPPPPAPPSGGSGGIGGEEGNPKNHPGHQAVLRHLAAKEKDEPLIRVQVAGSIVYDLFVGILGARDGRVRVEDLIAVLSSIGGHLCLVAVLESLKERGLTPKDAGIMEVEGRDGHRYFFGDEPNRLLLESPSSLLSLVLGAAQSHGAPVSIEMVHEVMKRTASAVGGEDFGKPDLPEKHRPALSPFDWVKHFEPKMIEALDLYDVPQLLRPCAVGNALQRAIDEGRHVLDPLMAAKIAIECSVPMAKVGPRRLALG